MNIADYYSVNGNTNDYVAGKTSQTNSKSFTIPEQPTKLSQSVQLTLKGPVTFIGYDSYDPFKDIAQTGGVNLPKYMQTKTESTRSDEEILKDIEELAKEHARTGGQIDRNKDPKFIELMDEYISSVSPDRASILENSVKEIYGRLNQGDDYSMSAAFQQVDSQRTGKKDNEDEKELIDYLIEAFKSKGNGKGSSGTISNVTNNGGYTTINIDHGGGMGTILNYVNGEFASMQISGNNYFVGGIENGGKITNADFYGNDGEKIASYDGNNLLQAYTKAEGVRSAEVVATYNAAHDFTTGRYSQPPASTHPEQYEAYNRTYEKLASATMA